MDEVTLRFARPRAREQDGKQMRYSAKDLGYNFI
jgi:hypothetical protein